MKLISLREFVLNQSIRIENCETTHIESHHQIVDYAKFLSRHLELGMFVPCDLEGNVLDQPLSEHEQQLINDGWKPEFGFSELEAYNEAKERVLFEGWKVIEADPEESYFDIEMIGQNVWLSFFKDSCLLDHP